MSDNVMNGSASRQGAQPRTEYRLKSHMKVDENNNVTGLDPVGNAVVGAYLKIQDGVVGAYKAVEGRFVDAFLEPVEPAEDDASAKKQA